MATTKHLSWENFSASVLVADEHRVHRVSNVPEIELFWDGGLNRVGMWIECALSRVPESALRLASLSVTTIHRHHKNYMEIACNSPLIFREFYLFATAVADRIKLEELDPGAAIDVELQGFGELLEEKRTLGIERQLGLLGELIILERFLNVEGSDALNAWIAPGAEPHDFRIGQHEFEVKTSLTSRRIHTINGLHQLVPSPNCSLFLLSILLGPAGSRSGFSLTDQVNRISRKLTGVPDKARQFRLALESCGYFASDATQYLRTFDFRRPVAVVAVNDRLPVITLARLQLSLGNEHSRIEHIAYDLNVEGLEAEDTTAEFVKAFPYPSTKE